MVLSSLTSMVNRDNLSNLPCFISEKMYFLVAFPFHMPQTVGLVPADRKNIETDLASDRKLQLIVRKLFPKDVDKFSPNIVDLEMKKVLVESNLHQGSTLNSRKA